MKQDETPSKAVVPDKRQVFADRYKALCQETGFRLAFEPVWVQSADMGDYRLSIRVAIEELKK